MNMMQLVLNTHGLLLKVKDKVFFVTSGDQVRMISPEQVNSIAVTAPCQITSAAIMLAADAGIPIYFYDHVGDARSCLRSPYFESLATLRRKQVYFSDTVAGSAWVVDQFVHKTTNQIRVLKYLKDRKPSQKEQIDSSITALEKRLMRLEAKSQKPSMAWGASLMGWEGQQARIYWQAIAKCMPKKWYFKKRSRRPAGDPFNAMVNYLYGMLYTVVEQAIFAAGLDPHLGVLHTDQYDRPTLAFDLIEPFRPWVDYLIVQQILTNKIESSYFEPIRGGYYLSDNGKRALIPSFNEWMQKPVRWQSKQLTREVHIYHAAAKLARVIRESTIWPDDAPREL